MPFPLKHRRPRTAFVFVRMVSVVALAGLFWSVLQSDVHAAEWGRARLLSGVGQPLSVEVPLRDLPATVPLSQLPVQVQAAHASDAGLADRVTFPVQVTLQPRADGQPGAILVVASSSPVPRGVVDLGVVLGLPQGEERRRLVLLLSPARHQAATPVLLAATRGSTQVVVQPNDTLGAVVARLRQQPGNRDATVHQWLVALFQANPAAFIQGNLNLVRAGAILQVPDVAAVQALDAGAARRLVAQHMRDFAALRSKVAGQAPALAATEAPAGLAGEQGQVQAAVAVPPPAPARDTLRLSSLLPGNGTAQAATRDTQAVIDQLRDERAATQRALADAQARVGELESTVAEMEQLLTLQNEALARLQSAGVGNTASPAAITPEVAGAVVPARVPNGTALTPVPPPGPAQVAEGARESASAPAAAVAPLPGSVPGSVAAISQVPAPATAAASPGVAATGPASEAASGQSPMPPRVVSSAEPSTAVPDQVGAPAGAAAVAPPAVASPTPAPSVAAPSASAAAAPPAPAAVSLAASAPTVSQPVPAVQPEPGAEPASAVAAEPEVGLRNLATPDAAASEAAGQPVLQALEAPPVARPQDRPALSEATAPGAVEPRGAAPPVATASSPQAVPGAAASVQSGPAAAASAPVTPAAPAAADAAVGKAWVWWGLGGLLLFALAVIGYLVRRQPTRVTLDDANAPAGTGASLPPLDLDFNLDLDSPPDAGSSTTKASGAASGKPASRS